MNVLILNYVILKIKLKYNFFLICKNKNNYFPIKTYKIFALQRMTAVYNGRKW